MGRAGIFNVTVTMALFWLYGIQRYTDGLLGSTEFVLRFAGFRFGTNTIHLVPPARFQLEGRRHPALRLLRFGDSLPDSHFGTIRRHFHACRIVPIGWA